MGDLLFKFSGRIGRLGYLLALICMGIAVTVIFMLQRFIGDWKFGSIFIIVAVMVPIIIYLAATSKRFQDRSRHPLFGFLFFFIIPALLIFGVQRFLGDAFMTSENMKEALSGAANFAELPQAVLIQIGAFGIAGLLFIYGQISLLLRRGTPGENVFDEAEELGVAN